MAATYIINQKMEIVWSFVDNNHGCWAEPSDVVEALEVFCGPEAAPDTKGADMGRNTNSSTRGKGSVAAMKPLKSLFGPRKQSAGDYVSGYPS